MILVDTSVWIDHFRQPNPQLKAFLHNNEILMHPLVLMELALGSIANRQKVIFDLSLLPQAKVAELDELFGMIEKLALYRKGIGVTDLHLLASALLQPSVRIWTRDKRLGDLATLRGVRY